MRTGVFLFGGVEMDDVGPGDPAPTSRRYSAEEVWRATERLLDVGVLADRLGYDSYWLTEHHFQYEGYEVVPNGILNGAILAQRTENIRIGTMVNIIGQWHPLRFAEDFSTLHNISGGRGILAVGRGTVPREAETLGTRIGSFDNPDKAEADAYNRRQFDEAMQVVTTALDNETFSFHGEFYDFPPAGIPDRGGFVEELTLVPRVLHPYEIWQTITSPPTLEVVPKKGYGGVFWLKNHQFMKMFWERYQEVYEEAHGRTLSPGEKRMLVLCVRVEDTYEEAYRAIKPGHDEYWKFLGPYGWSQGYMGEDGKPAKSGLIPTLDQSLENRTFVIGSPEDVAAGIDYYRQLLGGLEDLVIFPNLPGDTYAETEEQISRFAEEVLPLL